MTTSIGSLTKDKPKPKYPAYPDTKLLKNGSIKNLNTRDNVMALCNFLGYIPQTNEMTNEIHIPPELSDEITNMEDFQSYIISAAEKYDLSESAIRNHLGSLCKAKTFHPVREWLDQGEWDHKPRVRALLETFNFKYESLSITVMTHWLVSAIAALYEENFKTKLTPVIQSGQSCIKSTLLERLASIPSVSGDSFLGEASLNPKKADDVKNAISSWITELAEFESTTKAEIGQLKAFMTKHTDKLRLPYCPGWTVKARRTVFIGTVNNQNFLRDKTGNKRFAVLPMKGPVNIDAANKILGWEYSRGSSRLVYPENQRQFWLEVKDLYESGHSWNLPDSVIEQTEDINTNFTDIDVIEERFNEHFHTPVTQETKEYTSTEVCKILKLEDKGYITKVGRFLTARFGPSEKVTTNGRSRRIYRLSIRKD